MSKNLKIFLVLAGFLSAPLAWSGSGAVLYDEDKEDARAIQEFSKRVNQYISLHKTVEGTLPALKTTEVPELITAHQQALARKIREARPNARQGDIFTSDAREAFRHAIRRASDGSQGKNARATMKQGNPLAPLKLRVNDVYPEKLPVTTVPPTILLVLPKLPNEVAYRIVGRDLVLLDVRANMVVDLYKEAMPSNFGSNGSNP